MSCLYIHNGNYYTERQLLEKFNSTSERVNSARDWLLFNTNMNSEELIIVNGSLNNDSLGRMLNDGKIIISNLAPDSLIYHEAFHRIFNLFATDSDRFKLIDEFKQRKDSSKLIDEMDKIYNSPDRIKIRGTVLSKEDLIEEILAEEFREYKIERDEKNSIKKTIFGRILDFISKILKLGKKIENQSFANEFYQKINEGFYASSPKLQNRINNYRDSLSDIKELKLTKGKTLGIEKTLDIVYSIHHEVINHLLKEELYYDLIDGSLTNDLFKIGFNAIYDAVDSSTASSMIDNAKLIKANYYALLKEYKIEKGEELELFNDKLFGDDKSKDTEFNKNSIEFDPRTSQRQAVRLLVSSLVSNEKNSIGQPKIIPIKQVVNLLLTNLSNVPPTIEDFTYTLNKLSNKHPYISQILDILDFASEKGNTRLINDFIASFNNAFVGFDKLITIGGVIEIANANDLATRDQVISTWKQNLIDNINTNRDLIPTLENFTIKNDRDANKFFKLLGIILNNNYTNLKGYAQSIQKTIIDKKYDTKKSITSDQLLTLFNFKKDNNFFIDKELGNNFNVISFLSDFAKEEQKNMDDISIMLFNAENKPIYPVTQYHYLSMVVNWMNYYKNRHLDEQLEISLKDYLSSKMPYLFNYNTESSYWLKAFLVQNGLKMDLSLMSGIDLGLDNRLDFANAADYDYYSVALKLFEQGEANMYSKTLSITQGDRQIMPVFQIKEIVNDSNKYNIFKGYVKSELKRLYLNKKDGLEHMIGFNSEKGNSLINKDIIDINKLFKSLKKEDSIDDAIDELLESIDLNKNLDNHIEKNTNKYEQIFKDMHVKVPKGTYSSQREFIENWYINTYFNNIEQFKLFYGDSSIFRTYSNLWKRLNTPTSTGTPSIASEELLDELDALDNNYTFEGFNYVENKINNGASKNTIKEQFLKDVETSSSNIDFIENKFKEYYTNIYSIIPWKDKFSSYFGNETPNLEKLIEEEVKRDSAPYKKIKEADGFSYVNLFEWRRIMKTFALWTPKHDNLFNQEFEILKISMDGKLSEVEKERAFNETMSNGYLTLDEYFDDFSQSSLLKPQYSGVVYYKSYEDYVNTPIGERVNIYGIRKTSFMPLMPSVIFNTNLEVLHNKMLSSGTGITFYDSAAKDGRSDLAHDVNELIDNSENQLETLNGDFSTYLDYQFLKNQVYINTDEKTKIIDSTQSRKQIITDKYHRNIPFDFIFNNKELGFGNIENKWNSLSELEKEQQSDLHKTVNEYITFTNKVLERNKNFLLKEFEIASNKDLTEFELENVNQIIKLLKQAAIDRNNSLDIIDSFQYLLESSESTLFNVFPNPTKLQSLITSIVTNNVIKTKRLGNDYAQVSPVMWEKKGQKRINNSKTNNELLKSYSDLSPSEIMIPAPKDLLRKIEKLIIKKDPKIMESYNKFKDKYTSSNIKLLVEILNDLVNTGYLDSEVTLKGLRIPNQELSSNDVFKIKKFLLPTMSKFVVVNAELIAKTGSDFDIDKLNLYFKYLNSNLKEIVYSEDNSEEATKERFESFKQQELEDLLDYFTDKNIEQISQKLKEIKENKKELYDLNKDDLDKLFKQKGISNELKEVFFDKLNENLNDFLYDINTFNNTELFSLKLNSEQLEDILKVKNLFEFRNELYKVRHQKLKSVSSSLSTLINERNELNQTLNNAFQKLKDKRNPFKNKDFNELHNNYIKSKENVEDFLKNLTNGYPEINIVITQVQNRIENAQSFLDDWKNAKINKETLNKELIDSYFSKISDLKIKEKSLKDLEYELFKTLPVDEQNSMGAIFNKLSEIEQKLILSPLSMANLLHPIGDGGLEELLVSKLEKNVKKEERFSVRESKELSEVVEPENNLIKKNDMKEANIGIAQMATHGTGHAISKKTVISPSFWSSDYKIDLSTELLFEGFENNNDISSSFTQDSENIAQLISGHLTSQVDAASNPYAIYLNIRSSVNPISMYLLRRGVNKEIVYRFLIQPSILEFIKRRDIYTSPLYKNLNYKMSKKGGDILAIKDLEAIIGNPIMGEGLVLKKKDIAINMQNLKSISIKDLKDKSSLEDKSFQKNALFYFLALREQARLFSDYKKLMSSDTDYHKSLNSYQELSFIYEELKKSNFITNLDEMLNTGFIEGFTKAAKLYYYPWKSLFIGHRDFASHTNSYLNSYVNILSENLGFNRSEERKAKLKESMERQLFIYILNNYVNTSKLNPIEVLELGAKSIKAFNINKVLTIDKDYGEVSLKEDIIKSKAKSFHTFELNNYLIFMQKINSLESIKIGDDIITGKEFLKQLYIQSLKQSKNDFSPNDISNIIPGRVKMELLTEIMDKFLEMEKNGKINSNFFANFMVQFQLNNERYILSSPIGHLLGRGEENTIVDSQLNEYFLKGNYYTSDFNSFNTEIVEDTSLISSVKENIEKLNTVDLSNNSIKNLYFLDVASKDTVNGKKSFINKTKIDFEGSNVYLIPQDVFVNDLLSSISRTKIGTFENDELGNFHLKIDLSENISQQTTEQPTNKEIKPNEVNFDKELAQKIQDKLQRLYPEIKLNITNNPVWEQGDNVFNQLIEDDYFEGNPKYFTEVERISNLVLNKLKFKTKEFNGKYDESITDLQTYKTKVLNDLLKEIGITGVITNLDELKERLNSKELQTSLKENLGQVKESKENFKKQLDNFYSVKRLLNNYLKHFDLSKYDSNQQALIKQYLPNLFKDNKFKSDKQAIAFNKRKINSEEWANKSFNLDKITLGFLSNNAKEKKIETLLNYFKIEPKDAAERIYVTIENELNRRERFFISEKTQAKINAKIAEEKIKADNEKAERERIRLKELNKFKESTVVSEVEGIIGGRNIHSLEKVLKSENINEELAIIKNNGYSLDKTPNGKKSNLYQSILALPEVNGNVEIANKLKALVYSNNFTNWFGDWINNLEESSKIVDENGEPKLVYHGSGREYNKFSEEKRGSATGKWKERLSDSEMSFMFTDNPSVAFYYAIIERQQILGEILYYVRKAGQEPTQQLITEMYEKYPSIKHWVNSLKEKGLEKTEILEEFKRIYREYSEIRELSEGGAIGNSNSYLNNMRTAISYLQENKSKILKNGFSKDIGKSTTAKVPNLGKYHTVFFNSSKEYRTSYILADGRLTRFEDKSLNDKNIKDLTSEEYDKIVLQFQEDYVYLYNKIEDELKAGGFQPKIYPVFLNAKSVNSKDFKGRPFMFQQGDTEEVVKRRESKGAAFEVADLVEEALNSGLDGSIIENIADPNVGTNYSVFKANQIKSVFNEREYSSKNDSFYNQLVNGKIIGQANIKAMTVLVDAVNQKQDTLPHEYAHHYIAWYRNTPIVQEAIKKWGSEEALVQSIGEQVVKQKGEAFDWWNKFTKWILDKFNNLSKLQKQELTQILTDAFLTRQNLNQSTEIKPKIDSSKKIVNGFQGYKGGFENTGKGTPQGDGKDKAMRQVADGFIGELSFNYANGMYILGANSSTKTSLDIISNKIGVEPYNEKDVFGASTGGAAVAKDKNSRTIMLARNSKTKEKDLTDYTKISIKNAHEKGAEFVVGDMPNVDSQFIDYLQEIGAKFTIYHTGNESRIKTQKQPIVEENVTNNQNVTPVANIPQNKISGISSYGSLVTANNNVTKTLGSNPHSIDMIEAEFRTRTTRSESEMAKYAVKVGDVIKHFGKSADGTTKNILARVTAIHPKGTEGWKGTWYKEGWSESDVDVIDRFKDGAAAIEFEVITINQNTQEQEVQNLKILNSLEFKDFVSKELEKNPESSIEQLLEYYKKCK